MPDQVALIEIQCQGCGKHFLVEVQSDRIKRILFKEPDLKELIKTKGLSYGDPPFHEGCDSGLTMTAIPLRVIEFWEYDWNKIEWKRNKEYEINVTPDYWKEWLENPKI